MAMIAFARTMSLARQAIKNYFLKRPFCVSFEVTYRCNARCQHCHLGRQNASLEEKRASPQKYGELCHELQPVVAQVSGGEPLLRRDLEQIIGALKRQNRAPYIVLTTNGVLLTKKKYLSLKGAGVDEFSLSLDYPDERHDEFRGVPGLFKRIENLIKDINSEKENSITLSCVIQHHNFRDIIRMAELARQWKLKMNFSTYTWLRTNNKELLIPREELADFKALIKELLEVKRKNKNIYTSDFAFKQMVDFFEKESIPNCRAGERFLVVNPSGSLSPCGLFIQNYLCQKEVKEKFLKKNSCSYCYTAIRANSEKPVKYLIIDSLKALRS